MKTLHDYTVRVLPRRAIKEYRGMSPVKDKEVPKADWAEVHTFADAITRRWDTDAHIQALQVPGFTTPGKRYPRVGRTWAVQLWKDPELADADLPHFDLLVLDLDHGDKTTTWEERTARGLDDSDKAFLRLVDALRADYGCAYYLSRTGARLIALLNTPRPISTYEDYVCRFLLYLDEKGLPVFTPDAHGHHIDHSCYDLGRLFKLPLVPGSRPDTVTALPWHQMGFTRTLSFDPGPLLPWTFGSRTGKGARPDSPPPAVPMTYSKHDLRALKDAPFFEALTRPRPIAPSGERHTRTLKVAAQVARTMQLTDPREIYGILLPSVRAAITPHDREATILQDLWTIAHYVASGITADREVQETIKAARDGVRSHAFSRIAELTGCDPSQAPERIVLATNRGVFFPFDEATDTYTATAYTVHGLSLALKKHCPNLVKLTTKTGGFVTPQHLASRYASSDISEIKYVYGAEDVRVNLKNRQLLLPACAIRKDLTPQPHESVARWLEMLGGEHHEDLLDWLARFPDLTRPLCALYIHGEKGVGKNVLARGLAQIFDAEPVDYKILSERFQSPLLQSPLLHADESVQLAHGRSGQGTSIFRAILGSKSHQIEAKGRDHVWIDGFIRVLVTANNADALKIREDLSSEDVAAIQERVGYIETPKGQASAYLPTISFDAMELLITRHLPEHVLHLAATRKRSPEKIRSRFASWPSRFASTVKLEIGCTRIVAEALGRWWERLSDSENPEIGLFAHGDHIYVRSSALTRIWDTLVDAGSNRMPPSAALYTALRGLAPEDFTPAKKVRVGSKTYRAWCVCPHKILAVLTALDVDTTTLESRFPAKADT